MPPKPRAAVAVDEELGKAHVVGPLLATKASWLLSDYHDASWQVADVTEGTIPLNFDWLLPDGTRLHEMVNEHLCDTIKRVVFEMRTGPLATVSEGASQGAALSVLRVLVAWMHLNGIYRFSHLSPDDLEQHVRDRAKGKERCLDIPGRIRTVLDRFENRPQDLPSRAELFELAGNDRRDSALPKSGKIIDAFRNRHGLGIEVNKRRAKGRRQEGIAQSSLRTICSHIRRLWTLASRIEGDKLTFDPFPDGVASAAQIARKDGRTPTAPNLQTMTLIDAACRWVLDIGPKLLDLRDGLVEHDRERVRLWRADKNNRCADPLTREWDRLKEFNSGNGEGPKLVLSHHTKKDGSEVYFRKAINGFLPTACAIVIAAFTARRHKEVLMLEEDAISGGEKEGYWLHSYIEKTLQRMDATPCPAIVVKAVDLLKRWSHPARQRSGSKKLFRIPVNEEASSDDRKFRLALNLNDFARFVNVPAMPDGAFWHFAPHQFRRFFAITYVWRYDCGDLGALSHHLRHFNMEMTRRYVTDAEMGRMVYEEGRTYTVDKMLAIAHGDSKAGGAMGTRLQRQIERLRKSVDIVSDRDLKRKVERLVDTRGLILRGTPWGYCGSRNTEPARRRANCQKPEWKGKSLTVDGFPNVAGSTETRCTECIHNMVDQVRRPHWNDEIRRLDGALANPNLPEVIAVAMRERRAKLSGFVRGAMKGG